MAKVIIIAAVADNGVIGAKGQIPWHLPEDFKHFRRATTGHAVLMGENTFRSLGRALPERHNVVVSQALDDMPDVTVCRSYGAGLAAARAWAEDHDKDVYVIGGGMIYRQAMADADELLLSHVRGDYEGDVKFPDYADWREVSADDRGDFVLKTWKRKI